MGLTDLDIASARYMLFGSWRRESLADPGPIMKDPKCQKCSTPYLDVAASNLDLPIHNPPLANLGLKA